MPPLLETCDTVGLRPQHRRKSPTLNPSTRPSRPSQKSNRSNTSRTSTHRRVSSSSSSSSIAIMDWVLSTSSLVSISDVVKAFLRGRRRGQGRTAEANASPRQLLFRECTAVAEDSGHYDCVIIRGSESWGRGDARPGPRQSVTPRPRQGRRRLRFRNTRNTKSRPYIY